MGLPLTSKQQALLTWIQERLADEGACPTCREICTRFEYKSPKAATDMLNQLEKKGWIRREEGLSRNIRLTHGNIMGVPLMGRISAGFAVDAVPVYDEVLAVDPSAFGIKDRKKAFALTADGDSMIGRQIYHGDIVVLEFGVSPPQESIVAALIDKQSSLKTFLRKDGRAWLRAENPKYPDLEPVLDLQIQGVARGVIRKFNK